MSGRVGLHTGEDMRIETDINRIKELAAQKEDDNWRFRAFLKSCGLSTKELDAVVHRHYEEVSSRIDCCACANCCKTALPEVSSADIKRLASALKTSDNEIIARYLKQTADGDQYTFKRIPCPFLSENRCTVYRARPADCRSFPHLHKKEFSTRLIRVVENCSICPIVFNVYEGLKAELWHSPKGLWSDDYFTEYEEPLDEE
jgi:Fe-S-cluster containining protein